ncbi:hypothetical protein ID866_7180 [Astraeus odoratus]|nr:hypothetical protein ID866_7180 [Astraeus odoratus]
MAPGLESIKRRLRKSVYIQPWKSLYILYLVSTVLVFLPIWGVTYLFTRPRKTWSWSLAMAIAVSRRLEKALSIISFPDYRAIQPARNAEGVWIDPVPQLITAELELWSTVANVKSIRIPGYWYGKSGLAPKPTAPVKSGQKVFLSLHGSGFTTMSAHPKGFLDGLPRKLVELTNDAPHALAVEYRLSSTYPLPEENPFPAALLDTLAGYNHLVNVMGYDPAHVILVGDSAGGNLVLALTRYLVENKGRTTAAGAPLPAPPGQLILVSPWVDLSNSHATPGSTAFTNDMDVLGEFHSGTGYLYYGALAYLGPFGMGMASYNPYISPACLHLGMQVKFEGFPRTFIVAGGAERFLDQIRTLRDRMAKDMGKDQVTYYEGIDATHNYIVFPYNPGCSETYEAIQGWLG